MGQLLIAQAMPDIPYGDCFTVEARWDLKPKPGAASSQQPRTGVQSRVRVVFNKGTMFRRMIEKGVVDSCGESHRAFIAAAKR